MNASQQKSKPSSWSVLAFALRQDSLKGRTLRSMAALSVGTVFERVLRVVRNMVLARILVPQAFGAMAILLMVSEIFEAFTEVGVKQSVIQNRKGAQVDYLNVAWWFQSLRGLVLYGIAFGVSPLIADFYGSSELATMMRVLFVAVVANGFTSPGTYLLEKKIHFGRWAFLMQSSALIGTLVTVVLAVFFLPGTWALVLGFVAEAILRCILSFVLCPFMPSLKIDFDCLRDVIAYGRCMFGVPLLAVIAFRLDVMVLGKVVSHEMLGMYALAASLASQPSILFSKILNPILLPVLAERQNDKAALRQIILDGTRFTAVFGMPISAFLILCAQPLLSIVYGAKFGVVAVPFAFLCAYILVRSEGAVLSSVYLAVGRPDLHRRFVILRLVLLASLIYPASIYLGLEGAAMVVLFANLLSLCMQVFWISQLVGVELRKYLTSLVPGLKLASVVLLPMLLLKVLEIEGIVVHLVLCAIMCLVACVVGLVLLWRRLKT